MAFPNALESGIYALWGCKQSARGTPAVYTAAAMKKLRHVDGTFSIQREISTENFGDGDRFSNGMDYTNTLMGGGDPAIEGQPGVAAWAVAQSFGADSVTGAGPYVHVLTPANTGGRWLTFWKTVGGSVVNREKYNDCKISQLVVGASAAQKVFRVTPTVMSLDPGVTYDSGSEPTKADDGEDPFLYTQAHGTFNIDALGAGVVTEISELTLTINDGLNPWYGEDIRVNSLVPSRGTIGVAFTLLITDITLPIYNEIHYDTATPAAGTAPANTVHYGSIDMIMSYGSGAGLRSWRIQVPKVRYATDVAVAGRVDGGPVEMAIGGEARRNGTDPIVTMTATNADTAAY